MITYFWYGAGILTGFAAAFVMLPLARTLAQKFPGRGVRFAVAALAVVGFGAATLIVYRTLGTPRRRRASADCSHATTPGARAPAPGEQGQSLESAASKLEERLTREGGSSSDWQLLAQTYEVLGRPDDAARVRAQAASAAGASGSTTPPRQPATQVDSRRSKRACAKPHATPMRGSSWQPSIDTSASSRSHAARSSESLH